MSLPLTTNAALIVPRDSVVLREDGAIESGDRVAVRAAASLEEGEMVAIQAEI